MPHFQIHFLHDPCCFQFHSEHHSMLIRNNSIYKKYIDLKSKDSKIKSFEFVIDCLQTSNRSQNCLFICFVYMLSVASCVFQLKYPRYLSDTCLQCHYQNNTFFLKKKILASFAVLSYYLSFGSTLLLRKVVSITYISYMYTIKAK